MRWPGLLLIDRERGRYFWRNKMLKEIVCSSSKEQLSVTLQKEIIKIPIYLVLIYFLYSDCIHLKINEGTLKNIFFCAIQLCIWTETDVFFSRFLVCLLFVLVSSTSNMGLELTTPRSSHTLFPLRHPGTPEIGGF